MRAIGLAKSYFIIKFLYNSIPIAVSIAVKPFFWTFILQSQTKTKTDMHKYTTQDVSKQN